MRLVLFLLVTCTMQLQVAAVCTPSSKSELVSAVGACLDESGSGNCPNFALASNGAGCGGGGVNGAIGDWDVSGVTDMSDVFFQKSSFNADISNWDTSKVTTMDASTFPS